MQETSNRRSLETVRAAPDKVRFVTLSAPIRLAFPPLFFSSIPKRAIGFSYPSGREGMVLGTALLGITAAIGLLLATALGWPALLLMVWITGGTGALILYNSTVGKVAFIKSYCSGCRLRPLIEEHERMHLEGEASEEVVWAEARRRYTYEGLALADDPRICTFCPIAKRLRPA